VVTSITRSSARRPTSSPRRRLCSASTAREIEREGERDEAAERRQHVREARAVRTQDRREDSLADEELPSEARGSRDLQATGEQELAPAGARDEPDRLAQEVREVAPARLGSRRLEDLVERPDLPAAVLFAHASVLSPAGAFV
jgi:hypothetical protein